MIIKKCIAELIGTLILTLAVSLSLAGNFPVPTPVIAGLALGLCVYTLGSISGAHLNPAVTLGIMSIRKIPLKDGAFYIAAQMAGAVLAMLIAGQLVVMRELPVLDTPMTVISEMTGAFILAFGVAAAVHGNITQGASGLTVGGSLLLGISMATASNGVLNPAVALGIGSFSISYLIGPVAGAVLAMQIYKFTAK